ncbi:hypothetical protein E4191_20505 (plasmid) [Paracoccus liaowanqingii]|uniref:Nuclear transport factor 2 family protein n=1 Tax=Paracoccus liaowanqingii TaxID=2560053 RepID=A0A4Y5SU58_9RHOB|nr:hypothetical protein [Paracoccus liaowanqingii]QDA36483.1 hypothetical protein E4191_20505 [Paracoccus liaowanqingii]
MTFARIALVIAALSAAAFWFLRDPAAPPGPTAEQALPDLLTQVYRAYALEDEAAIFDALSQAATGDVVTDLYLQRRAAQVADHAEDGQTQILSVEVYDTEMLADPNHVRAAWRVVGRVRHAAHVHERINLYSADLALARTDDGWRLADFVLTQADRDAAIEFEGGE